MYPALETTLTNADDGSGSRLSESIPIRKRLPALRPQVLLGACIIAVVAVFLFFTAHAELWLDEVLSVNIARLPLTQIPEAVGEDGSAPLYYLLLHFWIEAFGSGNLEARSLSGVIMLAALPAVWLAGRRIGGPWAAWTAAALLATSPFAVTYATQARMYALVILLTAVGYLALTSVLSRVTPVRVVMLAVVSGLLLLSHYWSLFLLATVVAVLLASLLRTRRAAPVWAAAAIAGGGVLMVPWLPFFLDQLARNPTWWGDPASYRFLLDMGEYFADARRARWYLTEAAPAGRLLGLIFVVLAGLAVLRTRSSTAAERESSQSKASRRECLALATVLVSAAILAVTAAKLKAVSFESRYLSVVFVPFLLLVATGASLVAARWLRLALTSALVLLSAIGSAANIDAERSNAPAIAAAVAAAAEPGDVVGYCPDQLAPPVDRLLPPGLRQVTFPAGSSPERVNWLDYGARISAGDPATFAQRLDQMAGSGHDVWLVWADRYAGFGDRCGAIARELSALRPSPEQPIVLPPTTDFFEPSVLLRYTATR